MRGTIFLSDIDLDGRQDATPQAFDGPGGIDNRALRIYDAGSQYHLIAMLSVFGWKGLIDEALFALPDRFLLSLDVRSSELFTKLKCANDGRSI